MRHQYCDSNWTRLTLCIYCRLVDFLRPTNSPIVDDSRFVYFTSFSAEASIIFVRSTPTKSHTLLAYSPWNLSDTELTQWRSSADLRDRDEGGDCNKSISLTWCWEAFSLEYMAEVASTGSASDLYAGHELRLVFVSIDGPWDSYIAD